MVFDPVYIALTVVALLASRFVSWRLQHSFAEFSQLPMPLSGSQIAQKMLRDNRIDNVQVISVGGKLTDHYNPADKTVNLSQPVFNANNVAAAAVAAHECGHAVQDAKSYPFLRLRSGLVPLVSFSSRILQWVLLAGLIMAASGNTTILLIGIIMFATTTLFAIVTLPVEFDASARALKWLESAGIAEGVYHDKAKKALFWAAMTYTVAALASVGQLLYFISIFLNSRRN